MRENKSFILQNRNKMVQDKLYTHISAPTNLHMSYENFSQKIITKKYGKTDIKRI